MTDNNKDKSYENFFETDEKEVGSNKSKKRKGKVATIVSGKHIIIDVNGNGERIPYNPEKHSMLKKGDEIELP